MLASACVDVGDVNGGSGCCGGSVFRHLRLVAPVAVLLEWLRRQLCRFTGGEDGWET